MAKEQESILIKITDPAGSRNGHRAGVNFSNGVAFTEQHLNEGQVAGFQRWGYKVEDMSTGKAQPYKPEHLSIDAQNLAAATGEPKGKGGEK